MPWNFHGQSQPLHTGGTCVVRMHSKHLQKHDPKMYVPHHLMPNKSHTGSADFLKVDREAVQLTASLSHIPMELHPRQGGCGRLWTALLRCAPPGLPGRSIWSPTPPSVGVNCPPPSSPQVSPWGVQVWKRPPFLCLENVCSTLLIANLGPLIANSNSEFEFFFSCVTNKQFQGLPSGMRPSKTSKEFL